MDNAPFDQATSPANNLSQFEINERADIFKKIFDKVNALSSVTTPVQPEEVITVNIPSSTPKSVGEASLSKTGGGSPALGRVHFSEPPVFSNPQGLGTEVETTPSVLVSPSKDNIDWAKSGRLRGYFSPTSSGASSPSSTGSLTPTSTHPLEKLSQVKQSGGTSTQVSPVTSTMSSYISGYSTPLRSGEDAVQYMNRLAEKLNRK
jgi:hypothetical protein